MVAKCATVLGYVVLILVAILQPAQSKEAKHFKCNEPNRPDIILSQEGRNQVATFLDGHGKQTKKLTAEQPNNFFSVSANGEVVVAVNSFGEGSISTITAFASHGEQLWSVRLPCCYSALASDSGATLLGVMNERVPNHEGPAIIDPQGERHKLPKKLSMGPAYQIWSPQGRALLLAAYRQARVVCIGSDGVVAYDKTLETSENNSIIRYLSVFDDCTAAIMLAKNSRKGEIREASLFKITPSGTPVKISTFSVEVPGEPIMPTTKNGSAFAFREADGTVHVVGNDFHERYSFPLDFPNSQLLLPLDHVAVARRRAKPGQSETGSMQSEIEETIQVIVDGRLKHNAKILRPIYRVDPRHEFSVDAPNKRLRICGSQEVMEVSIE
jgi:hypothetical protein